MTIKCTHVPTFLICPPTSREDISHLVQFFLLFNAEYHLLPLLSNVDMDTSKLLRDEERYSRKENHGFSGKADSFWNVCTIVTAWRRLKMNTSGFPRVIARRGLEHQVVQVLRERKN
jgi:hypothetical protein